MKNLSNYKVNNNFYEKPLALQEGLDIVQVGRYYCKPSEVNAKSMKYIGYTLTTADGVTFNAQ